MSATEMRGYHVLQCEGYGAGAGYVRLLGPPKPLGEGGAGLDPAQAAPLVDDEHSRRLSARLQCQTELFLQRSENR